jgi:hypothetical protein
MRGPVVARSILRALRGTGRCDAGRVDGPGCDAPLSWLLLASAAGSYGNPGAKT